MPDQSGFFFDAPLAEDFVPAPQVVSRPPVVPKLPEDQALIDRASQAIAEMAADDLTYDDVLIHIGFQLHELTGWHRARVMDALMERYEAYFTLPHNKGELRWRRRIPKVVVPVKSDPEEIPLEPCRECGVGPTPGGFPCRECVKTEFVATMRVQSAMGLPNDYKLKVGQ